MEMAGLETGSIFARAFMSGDHMEERWQGWAQSLYDARRGKKILPDATSEDIPGTLDLAYRVQDRLIALEGGPPRLWKLGAPTNAGQKALGLSEPFYGPMFEDVCQNSPGEFNVSRFAVHVFEPEIAVTLAADLPCHDAVTREDAQRAIGSLHAAIEIINWRLANTGKLGALAMVADYAANGGFVVGPACAPTVDYWSLPLEVRINGARIAERTPPAEETDPAALLAWCARHLGRRGFSLKAGDIITTGSQAGVLPYKPGDLIEADFGAVGVARVQF